MNLFDIYATTLPIIGTQNLIMGITLLMIYGKNWKKNSQYKSGIQFMGLAMLVMAFINYTEYFMPEQIFQSDTIISILVFAASIELLLIWYTYIALLNPQYVTKSKTVYEVLCIILFTVPPLFIDSIAYPHIYYPLLYLSITYYILKYIINIILYRKQYRKVKSDLQNFYGDGEKQILSWIQKTFNVVLLIGGVSIFVPFTNYCIMTFYQSFLFIAYFYIYYKIIRHEALFDEKNKREIPSQSITVEVIDIELASSSQQIILFSFEKWINERHYATSGITIEDVASQLKTNRTTLSLYLNAELRVNFYEWISKIRIEDAKKMIEENPQFPIPEIAAHVGIEDRSNFDKLFKRIVGVSPATYRFQLLRNNLK